MKKRRKVALFMAAMMLLTMVPQNAMHAKADSPYARKCGNCGTTIIVEERTVKVGETSPVNCPLREHQSTGCRIIYDMLEVQLWRTCMTCGISYRDMVIKGPYKSTEEQHRTFA